MKIFIRNAHAEVAKINWNDKSFEVTRQAAIFESDDGEVRSPVSINLKTGQAPWPVGEYRVGDSSFYVDGKYKSLEMAREIELVPVKALSSVKTA